MQISPLISITLAALASHLKPPFVTCKRRHLAWTLCHSTILYCLPPHSILCWWSLTTVILRQWPRLIGTAPNDGPLGPQYAKVCEVIAASLLWNIHHDSAASFPIIFIANSERNVWFGVAVVLLLSAATCLAMHVWSRFHTNSHTGVQRMVKESIGKSLSLHQHIHLFVLAAMNAFCEEVTCRGFWRAEYSKYTTRANLWQATLFGIWHYHGIPSGWTGVGLTFVYGTIMGWLQDYFGGLLMPILAHALADYFIFSVIARNEKQPKE